MKQLQWATTGLENRGSGEEPGAGVGSSFFRIVHEFSSKIHAIEKCNILHIRKINP